MKTKLETLQKIWAKADQPPQFAGKKYRVVVGMATCGISAGAAKVFDVIREEIEALGIQNVELIKTGCIGMCVYEPIVEVLEKGKEKVSYVHVDPLKAVQIVAEHLGQGNPVIEYTAAGWETMQHRLAIQEKTAQLKHDYKFHVRESLTDIEKEELEKELAHKLEEIEQEPEIEPVYESLSINSLPFYEKQKRIVLKNCGVIDPEDINEYIALGGYEALAKSLTQMTPADVIQIISDSGLRGRGGAGFPTGRKWQFAANNISDQKYFICNADEGDPGAFMDRSVLEGDPHAIIEAMIIGGYAIGATKGYIYVRAEYPIAVKRLALAIEQAKEAGLLGENIFGTGFSFHLENRLGAGAFVCGEETALIASIEGRRGMPRNKPPFPAEKGLWNHPTVINNVETLANVASIIRKGANWFRGFGTEKSPGTKVFALGGKITHTGLVEVPMGIKLREIIEDIGGNCPNEKAFKAVQTGGPSGGCITRENFETPIDFDNLTRIGSMMGSGGMIVMDEDNCMVDIARFYLDFTVDESCGQCVPCREGTKRMLEILNRITEGHGKEEDLQLLRDLGENLQNTSLCALGQTAPNPVLSTLAHFHNEYEAHVIHKKCPAHVCRQLLGYEITDQCRGCTKCVRYCPVGAISGSPREKHVINLDLCIRCGECIKGCVFNAIITR